MERKPKIIVDIRCYETHGRTTYGHVRCQSLGTIYTIPFKGFRDIALRFALKLRELKFTLPGFDHLYVVLTPELPIRKAEMSDVRLEHWQRYVDVGSDPKVWNDLDDNKKHDMLVDLISQALLAVSNHQQIGLINDISQQLRERRSEIEIIVKSHETSKYRAEISLQITPKEGASVAFLSFFDKRSKARGRAMLTELELATDIFPLCGSISVKNDAVVVSPRSSFRASILTARYTTPFSVPIQDLIGSA